MHTLRYTQRLLLLPLAFVGLGCASTGNNGLGRSAEDKNVRTIASIGDRPVSSTTGTPASSSAVANLDEPTRKSDDRDLISGRVVDDRGDPVPNAKVRVADGGLAGGKVISAKTDRSGSFTLHGLRPGSDYTVIAEYEGVDGLVEGRSDVRSPETDVEIALKGVDDGPADRRRASKTPAGRTVSGRQALDEPAGDDNDDRPSRLNREDTPNRSDVEDIDELGGKTSSTKSKAGATAIAVSGWRRGQTTKPETAEIASNSTTDQATRQASSTIPPADADPDDGPPTSRARRRRDVDDLDGPVAAAPAAATANPEDDGDNPLPPAIHPAGVKKRGTARDDDDGDLPPPKSRPAKQVSQTNTKKSPGSTPGAFILAKDVPPSDPAGTTAKQGPRARDLIDDLALPAAEADALANTGPFAAPLNEVAKPKKTTTWAEMEAAWKKAERREPEAVSERASAPADRTTILGELDSTKKNIEACRYDSKSRKLINFRLPDLDGNPVLFTDIDSELIVLDFWGTWCKPCLNSIPHLIELQERLGGKKLTIIGIACEEGPPMARSAVVAEVANRLGINYKVLLTSRDQPSPLLQAMNVTVFPTMIVLDKSGRIVWRDQGATETTLARLDRAVDPAVRNSLLRR